MPLDAGRAVGFGRSRLCTLYDVARVAGVSTATVSRVVHGQDRVRASTRQRVLEVIEALGYVPDAAAQSMARQRKEVIGLVALENRSPDTEVEYEALLFTEEVLRGIENALSQIEWSLLISVLRDIDPASAFQRMLKISAKVDGLLIAEGIVGSPQLALLADRVPVTLIAGPAGEPHADVVAVDNRAGTKALVRHLIEHHGKARLFYVAGPRQAPDARERKNAFADAVAEHPGTTSAASSTAGSPRSAARPRFARSWPGRSGSCPTRSSAPTTRQRSGRYASYKPPVSPSPPTSPSSALTACISAPCSPRR